MADYNLGNWKEMLPNLMGEGPSMPNIPQGGKESVFSKMLTPAAQGGGLEKLAVALDLFGQGMGGRGFGATQMAQSSLAANAAQKEAQKQNDWRENLMQLISGMTPGKGVAGGNEIKITSNDDGSKTLTHGATLEPPKDKGEGFTSSPFF